MLLCERRYLEQLGGALACGRECGRALPGTATRPRVLGRRHVCATSCPRNPRMLHLQAFLASFKSITPKKIPKKMANRFIRRNSTRWARHSDRAAIPTDSAGCSYVITPPSPPPSLPPSLPSPSLLTAAPDQHPFGRPVTQYHARKDLPAGAPFQPKAPLTEPNPSPGTAATARRPRNRLRAFPT